jgi:hypothetical protein
MMLAIQTYPMKKILLFCLILVLNPGLYSQMPVQKKALTGNEILRLINEKKSDPVFLREFISDLSPAVPTIEKLIYDSLVTYRIIAEDDSEYVLKTTYAYDDYWNLPVLTLTWFWDNELRIWHESEKHEYAYDDSGRTSLEGSYSWDYLTHSWIGYRKDEYIYDGKDRLTGYSLFQDWDALRNDWIGLYKQENTFDTAGNWTNLVFSLWDTLADTWVQSYLFDGSFDSIGRRTSDVNSMWDSVNDAWIKMNKTEYQYNDGHIISSFNYDWNATGDEWMLVRKSEYEYLYGNDVDTVWQFAYRRDTVSDSWVMDNKFVNEYDKAGNQVGYSGYRLDEVNLNWTGTQKNEYTYDSAGNMTSQVQINWDNQNNDWINYYKTTFEYDLYGNITLEGHYHWEQNMWNELSKREKIYNADGTLASESFFDDYFSDGYRYEYKYDDDGNKISFNYYNGSFENGTLFQRGYYYWDRTVTGPDEITAQKTEIILYPNPAVNSFRVKGLAGEASLNIVNLNGQIILRKTVNNEDEVSVRSLRGGAYFVIVTASTGITQIKLVKE